MTSSEDSPRGGATTPALKPMCCVKCGATALPLTFISHSTGFGGFVRQGDLWCDACRAPSPAAVAAELLALAEKAIACGCAFGPRCHYADVMRDSCSPESIALVCKALLEGQRDSERLDWLEEEFRRAKDHETQEAFYEVPANDFLRGWSVSLRASIDAASTPEGTTP